MKDKMKEMDSLLGEALKKYDFKRRKKGIFKRVINDCIQEVCISETKIRGEEKVHIYIILSFTFKKLNNLIMYLQNDYYYKGWGTSGININSLINGKDIFGFYIEKNTDLTPIVEKITLAIENYGLPYFESCNSYEKFERQLYSGNEHIIYNLIFKFEWNILALSILLNEHTTKEIIEKYHDKFFEEESEFTEFNKRLSDQNKILEVIK